MFAINHQLLWTLAGAFAALGLGTVVRIVTLRDAATELVKQRMSSLKVWWTLTTVVAVAVLAGRGGVAVCFAIASWLGLKEFLRLVGIERLRQPAAIAAFACVPLQYAFVMADSGSATRLLLPACALVVLAAVRATSGVTDGYIRSTAGAYFGVALLVFCLSHVVLLFELPTSQVPVGRTGWFLFVVVLTEMNDIMQAIVGRQFGRRKITPFVSPNKTWEGLAGGTVTVVVLALALSPWLTSFGSMTPVAYIGLSVGSGVLISLLGFLGDINMSAIKRDVGVKDGSSILPGMGGIIDRVDSLTFTAPVFFHLVNSLH